jgi:hypothetical protein
MTRTREKGSRSGSGIRRRSCESNSSQFGAPWSPSQSGPFGALWCPRSICITMNTHRLACVFYFSGEMLLLRLVASMLSFTVFSRCSANIQPQSSEVDFCHWSADVQPLICAASYAGPPQHSDAPLHAHGWISTELGPVRHVANEVRHSCELRWQARQVGKATSPQNGLSA